MDNPKHKDGMLAAGKKRLEQFRLKKQGKGSSSKQNKQETDIEHGRPRLEVEHASNKGRKSKINAIISDFEGMNAKGNRMHTLSDDQGAANTRSGNGNEGLLHELIVEESFDKASPISIEHNPATSDVNIDHAHASHGEGITLKQCTAAGEETSVGGNEEFSITLDSPHFEPSVTGHFGKPLEQDHLDLAGAPDLTINGADLIAPDCSRNHDLANVEHRTLDGENKHILLTSVEAFQARDKEQHSVLEPSAANIPPCPSNDCHDVVVVGTESEHGDEMMANDNAKAGPLALSYSSPQVPTSSQSTSGRDEGDASQRFGHDFDTSDIEMAPSSPMITEVLEIMAPLAKEVETCSTESREGPHSEIITKPEPMVNVETEVVTTLCSEVDSAVASQTASLDNMTDSQCSFDQPPTVDLDVSMAKAFPESSFYHEGLVSSIDRAFEGSEDAATTLIVENTTELHCEGLPNESVPNDVGEFEGSQIVGELAVSEIITKPEPMVNVETDVTTLCSEGDSAVASQAASLHNVTDSQCSFDQPPTVELDVRMVKAFSESSFDHEGLVSSTDRGFEGSEVSATTPIVENTTELHFKGLPNESVSYDVGEFEGSQIVGELAVSLDGVPLEPVLNHVGLSPMKHDDEYEGLQNASVKPIVGISTDSHSEGIVLGSSGSHTLENAELDVGVTGLPPESSLDHEGLSLTNEFVSIDACLDGMPAVQREGMSDLAGTESSEEEGHQNGMPVVQMEGMSDLAGTEFSEQENLEPDKLLDPNGMPVAQREGLSELAGTASPEQEKTDKLLDPFPKTNISTTTNHYESGTSSPDKLLPNGADWRGVSGMPLDPEQDACGSGYAESSMDKIQESFPEDNLRSLEVVGAGQATVEDHIKTESIDSLVESADEEHIPPMNTPEVIMVSDASGQKTQDCSNIHGGPLLGSDNGGGIDEGEMDNSPNTGSLPLPVVLITAEGVRCFNGSVDEMTLPSSADVLSHNLEKDEITGPFENLNPPLEFRTAVTNDKEVAVEVRSNENTGISLSSCSKSILEETGDTCVYEKHEVDTLSLGAECDLATAEQGEEDVIAEAVRMKLEIDSLSSPLRNEMMQTHSADVCSRQPDLESNHADPSELSISLEHMSSAQKTSNLADHMELQDSPKGFEAVSLLTSQEAPLFIKSNEASEEGADPSLQRSLIGDLDSKVDLRRIHPLDTLQVGQEIEALDNSIPPVIHDTSGSLIEGKEGIELEVAMRGLRDTLCMKEMELENIITLMNAQAAKNLEERGMFVEFLMHIMKRLSHFAPQESTVNEYADSQFKLFEVDIAGSTKFEHFIEDYDCWMDKMQKDLEEKMELEATKRHLEDVQSIKDSEMKELFKQVEDLSQKCDEVQKHSDEKERQLKSRTDVLEQLLGVKDLDIERLSDLVSELSRKCDLTMNEMVKAVEERLDMEGEVKQLEALLAVKDRDIGWLSDEVSELSKKCDCTLGELAKAMEEKANLNGELKQLEDSLAAKERDLARMSDSLSELSQRCDFILAEKAKVLEEKVNLEGELKHFQNLHVEQESKMRHLEELVFVKDTELESLKNVCAEQESKIQNLEEFLLGKDTELENFQKLYADERDGRLNMLAQASALSEKITALLDLPTEAIDGVDVISTLEILVASLHHQYETIFKENKDLASRAIDSDTASEVELKTLKALVSEKEVELGHAQEKVDLLTKELSKTKEDGEKKLQEAEQKALGVRERLSLAVTKGKGLVQQRDNLKQLLAEKTAELEALALSHQQELHAKTVALNEAESKAKLHSEAGERVEALESELSYIRNSANALRESFLQKDAVLQKIEELLEDASLPEEVQVKDTYEKVEWLLEARNQNIVTIVEGPSEIVATTRRLDTSELAEQASQTEEIEQLTRKCDEYVRKYRAMAEELAMLEQSLLERNMLIQRWEEMLDNVDMPTSIRSKEPEDKIQWLGAAVSDSHDSIAHLQADMESLQTTADTLNHSLEKLQEQNSVLSAELIAKEDELKAVKLDLEDMTMKFNGLHKRSDEACRPAESTRELELSGSSQEESQQQQQFHLGVFVPEIRMLLSEVMLENEVNKTFADVSESAAFETSVKLLLENSKVWLAEARENKEKVCELTLSMRKAEEDGEKQIQSLHEAVSSKTLELDNLNSQLEGFTVKILSLEDEVDQLQKEVKAKTEELSFVSDELNKSQLEASQGEEKLASVREKLSMAVKKGKSVVQQRDALKQSLDEKVSQLDQIRRDYETESVAFIKAKQSFKHQLQELEAELTSSRKHSTALEKSLQENNKTIQKFAEALDKFATSGAPRSGDLMEKIQWTSQLVLDLQRKAGINEQEAKKSKRATELLALELEEVQGRMDSLADELMHAEKNISLLIEEKKLAEASKAEAGLRLEHAMANINSLLFELSELKETRANLEQENSSLKDSLAAQMEEIRFKHTKAEEQLKDLTDLYNKVHALKDNGSMFLGRVADEVFKLFEDVKGTRSLIVRISRELKEQGSVTLPIAPATEENFPAKWEPEFLSKRKATQEWKQGVSTVSIGLLCEEMEVELEHFDMFTKNYVVALNQESAANCQLLSELYNGLGSFMKKMEILKQEADFASSTESVILQKDEQIRVLEEDFKLVAENVRSCVEEVEGLKLPSGSFISPLDGRLPSSSHESLLNLTVSLVERLASSVKGLAQSCQQVHIETEKQNEELRFQLKEAKDVIDAMGQQQQKEKLKLQKCLEEFEGKDDILKRTNEELCSLHDILATKNQEEKGLIEGLEKAETKIGQLSAKVEELENAKQELEASLGKASSRFYATVNNFNKFQSLSEKLIEEAESLHLLLEDRDAQISLLKDEVVHKVSEVTDLQKLVDERTTDLCQLYQQIGGIVNREASNGELLPDPGRRREILEALATSVRAGSENLRVQLARKDALLQDIQLRHDDLARKVHVLESSVQESQRLMEERGTAEHMMITVDAEDKGNRGKHAAPSVALVSHGRGGRKAAADHSALDVDTESARLLADVDDEDKGHVFKPLTSSRLVPRGTRILVDRLDGFWVSGERLLRRKPGARLTVMLYWLVLNIWMVATFL